VSAPRDTGPACPTWEDLERFASGDPDAQDLAAHTDACAACSSRVDAIRADNSLLAEFIEVNRQSFEDQPALLGVTAPDGYDFLDEIHRGSQGVVYRAIQRATKRTVAVKMILHGTFASERQRHRFEREAELVASLQHPNIVGVYDSGVTGEGRHFLAMEYVDGVPLDVYVRARFGGGSVPRVDVEWACDLIARIADAMSAAHRRGIIHRDLKPENIIIDDDGQPHVLDFGLAKVRQNEAWSGGVSPTIAGEFLGTFAYASPEQVSGNPNLIDTTSDIYALGVVLYELLTGRRPYDLDGSLADVVDAIRHAPPITPRSLRPDLDRDVEVIVLQMLAKESERRYATMSSLHADLAAFLAGEPISARRHEFGYRARKFLRRHWLPITVLALVAAILVGSSITLEVQRRTLEAALNESDEITAALVDGITALNLEPSTTADYARSLNDVLDVYGDGVTRLNSRPERAAPLHGKLGRAYLSRRQFDEARHHLETALELANRAHRRDHTDRATALHDMGALHWQLANYDDAESYYEQALAMRRRLYDGEHMEIARTLQHLASTHRAAGAFDTARAYITESAAMITRLFPDEPARRALAEYVMGNIDRAHGRYERALEHYTRALDLIGAGEDFRTARTWLNIADCLISLDQLDEAERYLDMSTRLKPALVEVDEHGEPLRRTLDDATNLFHRARLRLARGELADALADVDECRLIREGFLADSEPQHLAFAETAVLRGRILLLDDDPDGATAAFREAAAIRRSQLREEHWSVVEVDLLLALADHLAGDDQNVVRMAKHEERLRMLLEPQAEIFGYVRRALRQEKSPQKMPN